jgi:molybdopterin synthase sulfur carrier subunit
MRLVVRYFAALRDAAGCDEETLEWEGGSLAALYEQARARHGFSFPRERLRVALDHAFVPWDALPREGSEVAFLPPVSGG